LWRCRWKKTITRLRLQKKVYYRNQIQLTAFIFLNVLNVPNNWISFPNTNTEHLEIFNNFVTNKMIEILTQTSFCRQLCSISDSISFNWKMVKLTKRISEDKMLLGSQVLVIDHIFFGIRMIWNVILLLIFFVLKEFQINPDSFLSI